MTARVECVDIGGKLLIDKDFQLINEDNYPIYINQILKILEKDYFYNDIKLIFKTKQVDPRNKLIDFIPENNMIRFTIIFSEKKIALKKIVSTDINSKFDYLMAIKDNGDLIILTDGDINKIFKNKENNNFKEELLKNSKKIVNIFSNNNLILILFENNDVSIFNYKEGTFIKKFNNIKKISNNHKYIILLDLNNKVTFIKNSDGIIFNDHAYRNKSINDIYADSNVIIDISDLNPYKNICSIINNEILVLHINNTVTILGNSKSSSKIIHELYDINEIFSTHYLFAALRNDNTVIFWGKNNFIINNCKFIINNQGIFVIITENNKIILIDIDGNQINIDKMYDFEIKQIVKHSADFSILSTEGEVFFLDAIDFTLNKINNVTLRQFKFKEIYSNISDLLLITDNDIIIGFCMFMNVFKVIQIKKNDFKKIIPSTECFIIIKQNNEIMVVESDLTVNNYSDVVNILEI